LLIFEALVRFNHQNNGYNFAFKRSNVVQSILTKSVVTLVQHLIERFSRFIKILRIYYMIIRNLWWL